MRKIFALLTVLLLSASSVWAGRTLDYNVQFFKEHYFYHVDDEMNVVDVNVEWPNEVNHTAVPVLQRVLSGLSFGVETERLDDARGAYLKRFGEPVKEQLKTIPDDKKYCYAHVNVPPDPLKGEFWWGYSIAMHLCNEYLVPPLGG